MAANLHTFEPATLRRSLVAAGFADVDVRAGGLASIGWAAAYYVLAGELPRLGASLRARRLASRTWGALRRLDAVVTERVLPERAMLTVRAVAR